MRLSAKQLEELRQEKWTELVVESQPPAPGATVSVRGSLLDGRPAARAKVLDSYPLREGGYAVQLVLIDLPEFELPKKPAPPPGALSADQRRRLFDGHYSPLVFDAEPPLEKGDVYVLAWQRERRLFDGEKVQVIPRERLFWIEITNVVRRVDAAWEVGFQVFDRRQPVRLMRRVPVLGTPEPEITSDPRAAVDRIERDGPMNWDGTNLLHLEEARQQHRDLHADRDREQETRSLTHRLRAARAQARERGVDDSQEIDAIREWIGTLERKLGAA